MNVLFAAATTSLTDVMTANLMTLAPDNKTIEALRHMAEGVFRHVPVVRDGSRLVVALLAATFLAGCGFRSQSMESDPLRESLVRIGPGTQRAAVHRLLGEPFYTSARWDAELYAGDAVLRVWWRDGIVPIPTFTEKETATVLVVYGPEGIVSGTAYSGPGCGTACAPEGAWGSPFACKRGTGPCVSGDLRGLDVTAYQALLAPAAAGDDLAAAAAEAGRCVLLVDAATRVPGRFDVYLDGRFLQRMPVNEVASFLRVEVQPGEHALACTVPVSQDRKADLPRPGRALSERSLRYFGSRLTVSCAGGAGIHVRLVNTGGKGILRGPACGAIASDENTFAARPAGSRMVIVPDRPE